MSIRLSITTLFLCLCPLLLRAQDGAPVNIDSARWNLLFQATSIGQYHGAFNAAYSGPNSLANHPEQDVSLTTTLFSDTGSLRTHISISIPRSPAARDSATLQE